uniref:Uncharacterized protein n=1 Tax=Anguilla anguilla TaxID=7936 RepID=A0A0E9WM52_ANGAN
MWSLVVLQLKTDWEGGRREAKWEVKNVNHCSAKHSSKVLQLDLAPIYFHSKSLKEPIKEQACVGGIEGHGVITQPCKLQSSQSN